MTLPAFALMPLSSRPEAFGARIRRIRRARGLSQEVLATAIGTTPTSLARWELGHVQPQVALFAPLARALGTTMDELYWGVEDG